MDLIRIQDLDPYSGSGSVFRIWIRIQNMDSYCQLTITTSISFKRLLLAEKTMVTYTVLFFPNCHFLAIRQ